MLLVLAMAPMAFVAPAIQMYLACFAASFKEAQGYMALSCVCRHNASVLSVFYPTATVPWLQWIPLAAHIDWGPIFSAVTSVSLCARHGNGICDAARCAFSETRYPDVLFREKHLRTLVRQPSCTTVSMKSVVSAIALAAASFQLWVTQPADGAELVRSAFFGSPSSSMQPPLGDLPFRVDKPPKSLHPLGKRRFDLHDSPRGGFGSGCGPP
jgi:hypothetical protein